MTLPFVVDMARMVGVLLIANDLLLEQRQNFASYILLVSLELIKQSAARRAQIEYDEVEKLRDVRCVNRVH